MTNTKKIVTPEGTFEIEMTAQEIFEREQELLEERKQAEISQKKYLAEQEAKANAKASAIAKLSALGLTEEEVKAIL